MIRYGSEAKTCASCKVEKPITAFHKQGKQGRHSYCADCYNARYRGAARKPVPIYVRRRQNIKSRYGLRPEDVVALSRRQGGVCAICKEPPERVCIDHDHATGLVRGILCHGCNIKLPAVEDEAYLAAALQYLGRRR